MIRPILLSSMLALLGACIIEEGPEGPVCGNGYCEAGETSGNCPSDCKTPPPPPGRSITCQHFADFNQNCTPNCDATWSCDASYDSLPADDQYDLDYCSDCLVDNLANGICADCQDPYVGSCQAFLEDLLGVDCW